MRTRPAVTAAALLLVPGVSARAGSGGSATKGQRPQHDIGVTVGVSLLRF